jgi:c-di-GMP-binding flagellar brake protein YcgR
MLYHDLGGKYIDISDRDSQRIARYVFQEQLRQRKKAQGL